MKLLFLLATLTAAALLLTAAAPGVTYVGHDKVAAALAKGGSLVSGPGFAVSCSHRDKAGQVEVHDKETDIMYVVDGEATFVTGGTMIGGKVPRPGQWLGTDIQGGESHQLAKGDVIVIPAGTPHWFKAMPGTISYYVVKVIKP